MTLLVVLMHVQRGAMLQGRVLASRDLAGVAGRGRGTSATSRDALRARAA